MNRYCLLLSVLIALSSCTKYQDHPMRPVSFTIGDKFYYSAKDTHVEGNIFGDHPSPQVMTIRQYGDTLDINYRRGTDFLNNEISVIGLNFTRSIARFEKNTRIDLVVPEQIEGYGFIYDIPYIWMQPIRSSSASDEDAYIATEGWIEFDDIDIAHNTVSGRFEFEAVLYDKEECDHPAEIKVSGGSFRSIPFVLSTQEQ